MNTDGSLADYLAVDSISDTTDLLWLRQQAEAVKSSGQKGMEIGTIVHGILEEWLRARKEDEEIFLQGEGVRIDQALKIVEWLDMHECEVEEVEVSIYHPDLLYGGQIDCIAKRGNSLLILDWKSGKGIYNSMAIQLAGYAMAYEKITGQTINEAWVLRSAVDTTFEAKKVKNLEIAKTMFMNLQACKEINNQIEWE